MRRLVLLATALAGAAGIQALAQGIGGLDLDAVRQRSAAAGDDARSFAEQVRSRGDAFRAEASEVGGAGMANMAALGQASAATGAAASGGAVDFDEIIAGASRSVASTKGDAPQFIAFASLSMPPQALRQLIADVARAGGVVVFRGFPDNSMKRFSEKLGTIVTDQDQLANIGIDPRLFRAFDVRAVPTFVAVSSDFDLCSGFACATTVPPHDRITGNVSVGYVLDRFVEARGAGAGVAAIARRNLEKAGA